MLCLDLSSYLYFPLSFSHIGIVCNGRRPATAVVGKKIFSPAMFGLSWEEEEEEGEERSEEEEEEEEDDEEEEDSEDELDLAMSLLAQQEEEEEQEEEQIEQDQQEEEKERQQQQREEEEEEEWKQDIIFEGGLRLPLRVYQRLYPYQQTGTDHT